MVYQRPVFYLISLWFMFLVAFLAVYRSVARWLEGYFGFLTAVRTSCFVHLSRTAWSKSASSTTEAATSFEIHIYISVCLFFLVLFSKDCSCKSSQNPLNLNRYMVSDLCAWHKNHKALYTCNTISFSGNALNCDIVDSAF